MLAGTRVLNDLSRLGLHIAIDDFGKGYYSLDQRTRLPVDMLKIDPTFVAACRNIGKAEPWFAPSLASKFQAFSMYCPQPERSAFCKR